VPFTSTLEDRIRDLCARAVSADSAQAEAILEELRAALREHMRFARKMTAASFSRDSVVPTRK
jgi:hypothetical protein